MTNQHVVAWKNGEKIPYSEAAVAVWDLGVVAGATISEMARTYGHKPFRFDRHLARLTASCRELGFELPFAQTVLAEAATEIVETNIQWIFPASDLGIVWFVTAGVNPTYVADTTTMAPTVCVHSFEIPFQQWGDAVRSGIRLTIPDHHQLPQASFPVNHKTRNRLHWWLADRAVAQSHPGSRALLLDEAGNITETSTACFYAVVDGTVLTAQNGVLRSTTCDLVQELCDRVGIRFRRTDIPFASIGEFQEAFLSSTPCGLLPVAAIDDHPLPCLADSVVRKLQAEWTRITGIDTFEQILQA